MAKVRSISISLLVLMILTAAVPGPAGLAASVTGGGYEVVSERNGEIVLKIRPRPDDTSPLPEVTFFVAIPHGGRVEAVRLGGVYEARPFLPHEMALYEPSADSETPQVPPGLYPPDPVVVSGPFTYRNTQVAAVSCYLRQLDSEQETARDWSGYQVVVRYPPARATRARGEADPLLAGLVVNGDVFPAPAAGPDRSPGQGGADPLFSLSGNWAKIEITNRGMYVITYDDLYDLFPNEVGAIDPATIRMFTGSGLEQKRDFNDPAGSWRTGNSLTETAIFVDVESPVSFGTNDRIIFYGLGAEDWMDYFDPSEPDTVYHVHDRAKANYYYVTWNGNFAGQPRRMQETMSEPDGGGDRTTYRERLYSEKNKDSDYQYGGDFWLWEKIPKDSGEDTRLDNIRVSGLVSTVPQEFRTVALAPRVGGASNNLGHHAVYIARTSVHDEHVIGEYRWNALYSDHTYEDGKPVFFSGFFLSEGDNDVLLRLPRDDNPKDWMYFAWYSMAYERRLSSAAGRLGFSSPDTSGAVDFRIVSLPRAGDAHVFDVTDRFDVQRLTSLEETDEVGGTRRVRFSSWHGGTRKHFWTATDGGLSSVAYNIRVIDAEDLRADTQNTAPHMVIVTYPIPTFVDAANRLAAHRRNHMPHFGQATARVKVVTTEAIFDNFSGGQPDAIAIRNYFKFLYDNFGDNGYPTIAFALLLGDATTDYKNFASPIPDRVPTFMVEPQYYWDEWFASDDWYGHLDPADQEPGYGVGDVGIGRLPAASTDEANALVDKVIGYETAAPFGPWRNQVVLVADDESTSRCESEFTYQSEEINNYYLPFYTDVQKVYLTEFPNLSGLKPAARAKLLELWNAGATVINYIGHGSSLQMADEIVFVDDDVAKLDNGFRLPVVMAFSCTVGDFANPLKKSLSEQLMLRGGGGAIGTVSASGLSSGILNKYLAWATFDHMLPKSQGDGVALGEAMIAGKLDAMIWYCPGTEPCGEPSSQNIEMNNMRYNLMGDPALRVAVPCGEIRLVPAEPDTLVAGIRESIRGAVYKNGGIDAGFNGNVEVRIHEPDIRRLKTPRPGCSISYYLRGGILYRGTADVVAGEFEFDFRVPRFAKPGEGVFLTAYANDGTIDAVTSTDTSFALVLPSLADTTLLVPVDGPPRVRLGFKSGLKVVKPGESLQAVVRDQDGINILSTTAEGRHSLLIDDSPVPVDVTRFFAFDHGGTDTSGVLTYPLPEMPVGDHRAILRVSDSFAQTTLDTLLFSVTDPMHYFADVVYNYPNPFATSTQFLIRLSNRASIRLDIFTLSGKRIRRLEDVRDGGEEWIEWDGRDIAGEEIANGTYLYVATVEFLDVDRAPLTLRGKLTKIQ
jgi:hypothetical protein